MEMCYDGALVMPSSYAVMCEDEMTYVEGGGKVRLNLTGGTIAGLIAGGLTSAAISGPINAALISLAVSVELGSAGWGTLVAAGLLAAAATLTPWIAGIIVDAGYNAVVTGIKITLLDEWFIPNLTFTI